MENSALNDYAKATRSKILENQSDLHPKNKALACMVDWCRQQEGIVVLDNHHILSSDPFSRVVPNCKAIMLNQQLTPGPVFAATPSLIRIILENAPPKTNHSPLIHDDHSPQQQRLKTLVKEALTLQATDIHLEIRDSLATIRLRRHGELVLHAEWQANLAYEISRAAFDHKSGNKDFHFNPQIPQHASISMRIAEQAIRLRLSSLPAYQGYDVVMRLLTPSSNSVNPLDELGYTDDQITLLKKAMYMPSGAILVAGPTGSGKTTTLASCMELIKGDKKIYSIEDPVEKFVEGITQIPVKADDDHCSFASMTRASLRMDPDVIGIGEVRDRETASVMCHAAVTGHLVLSTVHTNSAIDIMTRLNDLGVSTSLLASPSLVICLICQRLVPLLCQHCAIPIRESEAHQHRLEHWEQFFNPIDGLKARGKQCEHCHNQGISGRTVVAEIIWLDAKGREYIQKGELLAWREHLLNHGWKTYQQRLLEMAARGLCDPLDTEKLMGAIHPYEAPYFNYQD